LYKKLFFVSVVAASCALSSPKNTPQPSPSPSPKAPEVSKKKVADDPKALEILESLQKEWDKAKTYRAKFKQTVTSTQIGALPDEADGVLSIQKPDRLRWEQTDGSFQIINGKQIKHVHKNRRGTTIVDIYSNIDRVDGSKPLSFLTGKAKFSSLYQPQLVSQDAQKAILKLIPRVKSEETFIAEIRKAGYFLDALTTETPETKVVMRFSEIKTNLELDKSLFEYKEKKDDVVNHN